MIFVVGVQLLFVAIKHIAVGAYRRRLGAEINQQLIAAAGAAFS